MWFAPRELGRTASGSRLCYIATVRVQRLTILGVVLVAACSTLETGTIGLVEGQDDPFTEPPCTDGGDAFCGPSPNTLVISEVTVENADGGSSSTPTVLATEPYTGGSTITLPQVSSDDVDILRAAVFDSADADIIFGQTLPVALGGIDGLTLDLFIQRRGQFAVMPSPLPSAPTTPIANVFVGRYILVGSETSDEVFLYDLLLWGLAENADGGTTGSALPCTPLSMAPIEGTTFMLLICNSATVGTPVGACANVNTNGDLVAFQYDLSGESCTEQVDATGGGSWSSVAGGATVVAPNGDAFIVGGTRPASLKMPATNAVVKVGTAVADGDSGTTAAYTSFLAFQANRTGAAAVWVPAATVGSTPSGLVILGGNTVAGDPGIEYLGGAETDASTHETGDYPTDMTQGEGAATLDSTHILVAGGTLPDGGTSPVRLFDLACSCSNLTCQAQTVTESDAGCSIPDSGVHDASLADASGHRDGSAEGGLDAGGAGLVPLVTAQGFATSGASAFDAGTGAVFVGNDKSGSTHAFLVSTAGGGLGGVEIPLRVPRSGATAILTPVPSLVVIGGDTTMESYIP